jgi:hypothetical protein
MRGLLECVSTAQNSSKHGRTNGVKQKIVFYGASTRLLHFVVGTGHGDWNAAYALKAKFPCMCVRLSVSSMRILLSKALECTSGRQLCFLSTTVMFLINTHLFTRLFVHKNDIMHTIMSCM